MNRPRIKICGITRVEDALTAAELGADAIGLVFYAPSPRAVMDLARARDIAQSVGPFVSVVGLFVNANPDQIRQVLEAVPLHVLQFHGDESIADCERYLRPYVKALRMREGVDVHALFDAHPTALALLLDTYKKGVPGGTGEVFDWARFPQSSPRPCVLAGGLTPENIAEAVIATRPYGVDVSGGVESSPGIKSREKMSLFIENVKRGASAA